MDRREKGVEMMEEGQLVDIEITGDPELSSSLSSGMDALAQKVVDMGGRSLIITVRTEGPFRVKAAIHGPADMEELDALLSIVRLLLGEGVKKEHKH